PMVPFMTEEIYRNLVCTSFPDAPKSVHLCDYPKADGAMIDRALEETMDKVRDIKVLGSACRNTASIKNRQPVARMFVRMADAEGTGIRDDAQAQDILRDELNVKELIFAEDVREFTSYAFKPQLKTVGPKYGKLVGAIGGALKTLDGNAAMEELNEAGKLTLSVNGETVELTRDDLLIEMTQKDGYISTEDHGITVVLDTNLTPELLSEGVVNEVISKLQNMRKDAGFEVMDRITVSVTGSDRIASIVKANEAPIAAKVLADAVDYETALPDAKEWDFGEDKVTLGVKKN
ncbi:MAG: class I tRNA ligase family protein, partial [Lachnospiraceae bacterium]|nr:class I tRNA ligase family protein [Lachnospiraceae bacterium]